MEEEKEGGEILLSFAFLATEEDGGCWEEDWWIERERKLFSVLVSILILLFLFTLFLLDRGRVEESWDCESGCEEKEEEDEEGRWEKEEEDKEERGGREEIGGWLGSSKEEEREEEREEEGRRV